MKLLSLNRLRTAAPALSERYLSPALRGQSALSIGSTALAEIEARIHDRIWGAILDRRLRPGAKLKEETICEAFGVSRTIVRKVLVVMEQEGTLTLPINRGAFVASPVPDDIGHIFEAARLLTTYIVEQLATHSQKISQDSWDRIAQHLEAENEASAQQDVRAMRRLAIEFQLLLAVIHGNPFLSAAQERAETMLAMILTLYQEHLPPWPPFDWHRTIVDHIRKGQVQQAVQSVEDHFKTLQNRLTMAPETGDADLRSILIDADDEAPRPAVTKRTKRVVGPRKMLPKKPAAPAKGKPKTRLSTKKKS